MDNLITLQNVSYFRNEKKILDKISFTIGRGEKIALLGSNGAGKSTLIDIMTQDINPTDGNIFFDRTSVFPKNRTGVLYGCLPLFPYLRVFEQIRYFTAIYRLDYKEVEKEYYKRLGIDKIENSFIYQLSQGERQKLGLLISIINNPELLIWDEPFSNLDPTTIDTFWGIVNSNKKTIFYSTHNWEDAMKKSTKVCLLHEGRLLEEPKNPVELLSEFQKQNVLIVGIDNLVSEVIINYKYYKLDGCCYVFWNTDEPIVTEISKLTTNFSVKKISLIDYYRYRTSKL